MMHDIGDVVDVNPSAASRIVDKNALTPLSSSGSFKQAPSLYGNGQSISHINGDRFNRKMKTMPLEQYCRTTTAIGVGAAVDPTTWAVPPPAKGSDSEREQDDTEKAHAQLMQMAEDLGAMIHSSQVSDRNAWQTQLATALSNGMVFSQTEEAKSVGTQGTTELSGSLAALGRTARPPPPGTPRAGRTYVSRDTPSLNVSQRPASGRGTVRRTGLAPATAGKPSPYSHPNFARSTRMQVRQTGF